MLTTVKAGPFTVRGVSVGGVYTSLQVRELGVLLDVGIAPRSFAGADFICLSHAHADHVGALASLMGIRGLHRKAPPRVVMPAEVVEPVSTVLSAFSAMQRYDMSIDAVGMKPGDEVEVRKDLFVRAFRTHHPVPSLGYTFFRRVQKLKAEYAELPGAEIGRLRQSGVAICDEVEQLELSYATDTLLRVIDTAPEVLKSRVLILECTFLDDRKDVKSSRQGCHIHLDELLECAYRFENEALVLMHFSQLYTPREVHRILEERCPDSLREKLVVFAPSHRHWPG